MLAAAVMRSFRRHFASNSTILTHKTIVSTLGEACESSVISRVSIQDDTTDKNDIHNVSGVNLCIDYDRTQGACVSQ